MGCLVDDAQPLERAGHLPPASIPGCSPPAGLTARPRALTPEGPSLRAGWQGATNERSKAGERATAVRGRRAVGGGGAATQARRLAQRAAPTHVLTVLATVCEASSVRSGSSRCRDDRTATSSAPGSAPAIELPGCPGEGSRRGRACRRGVQGQGQGAEWGSSSSGVWAAECVSCSGGLCPQHHCWVLRRAFEECQARSAGVHQKSGSILSSARPGRFPAAHALPTSPAFLVLVPSSRRHWSKGPRSNTPARLPSPPGAQRPPAGRGRHQRRHGSPGEAGSEAHVF